MECCDGANRPAVLWMDTGRNYASTLRHYSSPSKTATITTPTRYSSSEKQLVTQTLGISTGPNNRAPRVSQRRLSQSGSAATTPQPASQSSLSVPFLDGSKTTLERSRETPLLPLASSASPVVPSISAAAKEPITDTRVYPSSTSSPGNTLSSNIIRDIANLLSPRSSNSGRSVSTLIALYQQASKGALLHCLDEQLFSEILSLCGTLSLSSRHRGCVYDSRLVSYFQHGSLDASQLASFIIEAARDMEGLGFNLSAGNRYWITEAYLALGVADKRSALVRRRDLLSSARVQYEHLKGLPGIPEIHLLYLSFLLSTNSNAYLQEAVHHLFGLLESTADPHFPFAEILWETIALRGSRLSPETKERICVAAFQRINRDATHHLANQGATSTSSNQITIPPGVLGIPHLTASFASTLFPSYNAQHSPNTLRDWAITQARQALLPSLPLVIRWGNLVLLAVTMSPAGIPIKYQPSSTTSPDSGNSLWRTALMLETLDRRLAASADLDSEPLRESVQNIARALWRMFMTTSNSGQPVDINRAYVATFLRIAAQSHDNELIAQCFDFCQRLGLWTYHETDPRVTQLQALNTIVAYSAAFIACKWQDWARLYSIIGDALPNNVSWQSDVSTALIQHYVRENIDIAFNVYLYSRQNHISISDDAVMPLALALVREERWRTVPLFLDETAFSRACIESVLGAVLRVFQVQRYEHADGALVKILSRLACKLFEDSPPLASLKYPIRYFLSMMIWTQNTSSAVKLIASLKKAAPEIFTIRLVRRLVLQLARRRQYSSALKIHGMFDGTKDATLSRSVDDIRQKLALKFSVSGAHELARNLSRRSKTQVASVSRRDALVRAVSCRRAPLLPLYYAQVRPIIAGAAAHAPTVRHAISVLVKSGRLYAARKLYAKTQIGLDPKTRAAIGNIILHGPMTGSKLRNGRLVRNILKMKDRLATECGFVSDRATINIILKALLRWTAMIDSRCVRQLFDQMAHEGYPVPERWRRHPHGVPFGSPRRKSNGFSDPPLSAHINFNRHTRPMYKMFIKAFYLRKDVPAAKAVVGILKEVQAAEIYEREKRNRARRQGVVKKKTREMKENEGRGTP